jgi:hypothetical protein
MKGASLVMLTLALMCSFVLCSCGPFGIIPLAGLAAGGGGGGGAENPPPTADIKLPSTDPADGAAGVDIYRPVLVRFSKPVNTSTVTPSNVSVGGNPGTFYFDNGNEDVIFLPSTSSPLPSATTITVTVNGVQAASNPAEVVNNYQFSFTTGGASIAAPEVYRVWPEDSSVVPFQTYIPVKVLFTKPMSTGTVDSSSFCIRDTGAGADLNGSVSWDANLRLFTFTPTDPMAAGKLYEIHVLGTVEDSSGTAMGSDFVSGFTTLDLTPSAVYIPSSAGNPADWINAQTRTSVTVRVDLAPGAKAGDFVHVNLDDTVITASGLVQLGADGLAYADVAGINCAALSDGFINLDAQLERDGFRSNLMTGSADKDTSAPSISLAYPSQLPQYCLLRQFEFSLDVDSDCYLNLEGGDGTPPPQSLTAGPHKVEYNLKIADTNNVNIYATDDAGNESNRISGTIRQRGGAGGGAINGNLQVSVYRDSDLTPVGNAMVIRGMNTDEVLYTDAQGIVTFSNVYGPQTITISYAGYPLFTAYEMDANHISLPLQDQDNPRYATVQGSVNPAPTTGIVNASCAVDWESEDIDISDGNYALHVGPNKFYTLSALDSSAGGFSNFTMKANLGPLTNGQVRTENLNFPVSPAVPTRLDSGNITLPTGVYLPAAILWPRGQCLIMSRSRGEAKHFMCGYGAFPLDTVSGGPFAYSTIQPVYFPIDLAEDYASNEYRVIVQLFDIRGRQLIASGLFPDGGPLPHFAFPELPTLKKPGLAGVAITETPQFTWDDSNFTGLHIVRIANLNNGNMWFILREAGIFELTLPAIPATSMVKVMEYSYPMTTLVWSLESYHPSGPFDYRAFTQGDMELSANYVTQSEWRPFWLWNPSSTSGRVPVFGTAGEADGSMRVTVADTDTQVGIPGATVYLGNNPSSGSQVTDAFGQVTFNGLAGPRKLTVCHPSYPYMTFDQANSAYVTVPLFTDFEGQEFTLYGEVTNLPTSDSWVEVTEYNGSWFQPWDDPPMADDAGHTAYTGPSPENYSLIGEDRQKYQVVTGFQGVAVGDAIFDYAYFSDVFEINPTGSPPRMQAPDINYNTNSALGHSPMRRVTDPSSLIMPANLIAGGWVDWASAEPIAITNDNPWSEQAYVKIGQGEATSVSATQYEYGITFASPPNFNLDQMILRLSADGENGDGTSWNSELMVRRLWAYPRRYDTTLPSIPYPIYPGNGDTGVGLTPTLSWSNVFAGENGLYMIGITRTSPRPFAWMLLTPIPNAGPGSISLPALPSGFNGPETGVDQDFAINSNVVPGFDYESWAGNVFDDYEEKRSEYKDAYFTP